MIRMDRASFRSRRTGWCWGALALLLVLGACTSRAPLREAAPASAAAVAPAPPVAAAPGLGTQWGEGRESRVQSVEARRLDPERPDDQLSIAYDSAAGVRARVGRAPDRQLNVVMAQGDVEWSVRDGSDRALPLQRAGRDGPLHVAGVEGERYTLVFRNLSERVYEVVATVDGLDVMSGQPGSLRRHGYVLRPGALLRIEGFRKSQQEVAAFRFATPSRAYAANTEAGDPRNIGVLGAALFELSLPGQPPATPRRRDGRTPNAFPADAGAPYAPPPRYPAAR